VRTNVQSQPKPTPEHLRLIDLLKLQLKKAEAEIQSLHNQLTHAKGSATQDDIHEKNVKLATLQHRFENLETGFNTQKQMLEKTKAMLEEVNKQLYEEKKKNSDLEVQLRSAEMASAISRDLQLQLEETRKEKRMLEAKIKDLSNSPFLRDLDEKSNNPLRLKVVIL